MKIVELIDDAVEFANAVIRFVRRPIREGRQRLIVERLQVPMAKTGAAPVRDRDVQGNPVHPGRELPGVVE